MRRTLFPPGFRVPGVFAMPLTTPYDNTALRIGIMRWFISADVDAAGTGGWRYMGLTGESTTITFGEQRLTLEIEQMEGSGIGDYAVAPSIEAATSLTVINKTNLAETRQGSTAFVSGANLVAVGIGRDRRQNITTTLPTILLVPEWCDLAAMAADANHADWLFCVFLWRVMFSEQGAISANHAGVAQAPIRATAVIAQTPAGMSPALPADFRLYYRGNPKAAPVGHAIRTVADAMVLPNLAPLVEDFTPADFLAEEVDAFWGDPFLAPGAAGAMRYLGRLAGARSITFATKVDPVRHPQLGDTAIAAVVSGASAAAELNLVELDLDTWLDLLNRRTAVQNAVPATVGMGAGLLGMQRITTRPALLLRPVSATNASRDFLLCHAVPVGPFEEPTVRARREMRVTFQGRYHDGAQFPAGARLAIYGDAVAAGAAVLYDT